MPGWTCRIRQTDRARLPRTALTRRRAVDFCRVSTAICWPAPPV
ncbi:MAG: putative leader peptide [Streptosporangiaceae bacterium]